MPRIAYILLPLDHFQKIINETKLKNEERHRICEFS